MSSKLSYVNTGDDYVPMERIYLDRLFSVVNVAPSKKLIDLGSGDGRVVVEALKQGIDAIGCEIDPTRAQLSRKNIGDAGYIANIIESDFMTIDWSLYDVLTLNLDPTEENKTAILAKWGVNKKKNARLIWMNGTHENPFITYT